VYDEANAVREERSAPHHFRFTVEAMEDPEVLGIQGGGGGPTQDSSDEQGTHPFNCGAPPLPKCPPRPEYDFDR
jgi:hypothetical protein